MSETKIKPCPFCGEEAEVCFEKEPTGYVAITEDYLVRCRGCSTATPKYYGEADAIKAWNKRHCHDDLVAVCEDLLSAVGDELGACSLEEIENHPTLKAHSEIYNKAKAALAQVRKEKNYEYRNTLHLQYM